MTNAKPRTWWITPLSEIVKDFIDSITPEEKASLLKYDMATLEESIRVFKLLESFRRVDRNSFTI